MGIVQGYFWSIILMLSMPFLLLLSLSTYFYILVRTRSAAGPGGDVANVRSDVDAPRVESVARRVSWRTLSSAEVLPFTNKLDRVGLSRLQLFHHPMEVPRTKDQFAVKLRNHVASLKHRLRRGRVWNHAIHQGPLPRRDAELLRECVVDLLSMHSQERSIHDSVINELPAGPADKIAGSSHSDSLAVLMPVTAGMSVTKG